MLKLLISLLHRGRSQVGQLKVCTSCNVIVLVICKNELFLRSDIKSFPFHLCVSTLYGWNFPAFLWGRSIATATRLLRVAAFHSGI